jgi:hypothetical protein
MWELASNIPEENERAAAGVPTLREEAEGAGGGGGERERDAALLESAQEYHRTNRTIHGWREVFR